MQEKVVISRFKELMIEMGEQLQWGERNSASGSTKRRVRLAKQLLECLSGGDVDSMLRDVIGISSLWKCVAPPCVGEMISSLEVGKRRRVFKTLDSNGWKFKHFAEAGIKIGRKAWDERNSEAQMLGRPRKTNEEMAEVVDSEHRAASAETSITLKRLSKVRDSTVTIQNVLPTFRSIYESSSLRDKISMTTFRRMRKEEFRKLARRTDVCNYCLAGQSIRKKLGKLLKSAKGKSGYSMSVWNVSRSSGLILQCMLNSPGSVPQNIKLQAAEYIQQLVEIDLHTEEFRRQNAIYAEKTQDPGDSLVITLDYKEKGTLPQVPQEGNSHFYEQGKYSCLGVCIHTRSGNKTERHFVNFLLPHTNQTSIVTYLALKKLWNMEVVSKDKPMHFWFDSGTHFQNITVITEVLSHPRVSSVNFFPGRHGKSHCDRHFGSISNAIQAASNVEPIKTLTDVAGVLRTLQNTHPCFLFFPKQTVTVQNLSLSLV